MDCTEIIEQDVVERYLLYDLNESEQDTFERHYFECKDCFERLCAARAVQEAHHGEVTGPKASPLRYRGGLRNWTAAVTVLVLVLGAVYATLRYRKSQNLNLVQVSRGEAPGVARNQVPPLASTDSSIVSELGRIDPPPYSPVVLRGSQDQSIARFQKAMQHYLQKDYASPIPGLQEVLQIDPDAPNANFYLGACYLLVDKTDLAIPRFQKTISLHELDYEEQAHFYLAKALIRKNDLIGAKAELDRTIQLHGDREDEARNLEQLLVPLIRTTR